jgi:hypothetical protein
MTCFFLERKYSFVIFLFRKRVLGRQKKHLGDLSLQAGLPAEAWNYYQASVFSVFMSPSLVGIIFNYLKVEIRNVPP